MLQQPLDVTKLQFLLVWLQSSGLVMGSTDSYERVALPFEFFSKQPVPCPFELAKTLPLVLVSF